MRALTTVLSAALLVLALGCARKNAPASAPASASPSAAPAAGATAREGTAPQTGKTLSAFFSPGSQHTLVWWYAGFGALLALVLAGWVLTGSFLRSGRQRGKAAEKLSD